MKQLILNICFLFVFTNTANAQLHLEGILGAGLNLSLTTAQQTEHSPFLYLSEQTIHFPGISIQTGIGARLFLLDKEWSLGAALIYDFKYHESNSEYGIGVVGNTLYPFHLIEIPLDLNYNFKNNIGVHLGGEMTVVLSPRVTGLHLHIQDKIMLGALAGISYTKGRFRFELLYKHYFSYYMKRTFNYPVRNVIGIHTDYTFTRFHDIQFRVAVRLFSANI